MRRGRKLVPLDFDAKTPLVIGGFKALDFFGDGSFYILDVPGVCSRDECEFYLGETFYSTNRAMSAPSLA